MMDVNKNNWATEWEKESFPPFPVNALKIQKLQQEIEQLKQERDYWKEKFLEIQEKQT